MARKKIDITLIIIALGLMMGCAKPIMPAIKYDKPIDIRVPKNAYLNWKCGKEYASAIPVQYDTSNGLVGVLVSSAVDSVARANNPSRYTMRYGKAEQAIFMTSLRDTLEQNQVFKQVILSGETQAISGTGKDVLIEVFFKSARVASPERGYNISLRVDLTIRTDGRAPFKRTYVVYSGLACGWGANFCTQQTTASTRLLNCIVSGIEEWYELKGKK